MSCKLVHKPSVHAQREEIPVEFLILHYTACTLEKTFEIFNAPGISTHSQFVLDVDGTVYDLGGEPGGFWNGPARKGVHAGKSEYFDGAKKWETFNLFSYGIEIVNLNGNLIPYPPAQMSALIEIARHLIARFPALRDPARVLGHEHIAGFRGKVDPGLQFDWDAFYRGAYAGSPHAAGPFPARPALVTPAILASFEAQHGPIDRAKMRDEDWPELSTKFEQFMSQLKT